MPISRPILIALVAAVVAAVGFYATQGAREASDDAPSEVASNPAPPAAVQDTPPAKAKRDQAPAKEDRASASVAVERADRVRSRREAAAGIPLPVQRALDDRKLVILFFYKAGSADDRATGRSVAALRGPRVAVFSDPVGRLAKYRGLIGQLGISQAPAVVIIRKDRTARVVEGYIDPATLAQDVADAR
jgi:hypothetical protein